MMNPQQKTSFRQKFFHRLRYILVFGCAGFVIFIISGFLLNLIIVGVANFHFYFFYRNYNPTDVAHSGVWPFIVTTGMLLLLVLIICLPLSFFISTFLGIYFRNTRISRYIVTIFNIFNTAPSIVIGMFGMAVFVMSWRLGNHSFSILAGALTMVIVVLPTFVIGFTQALLNLPSSLRFSALALGATELQVITGILIPRITKEIIAVVILAVSRIIGESAPVFLTMGSGYFTPNGFFDSGRTLGTHIFFLVSQSPGSGAINYAYGISFMLVLIIFTINVIMRFLLFRQFRRRYRLKKSRFYK